MLAWDLYPMRIASSLVESFRHSRDVISTGYWNCLIVRASLSSIWPYLVLTLTRFNNKETNLSFAIINLSDRRFLVCRICAGGISN